MVDYDLGVTNQDLIDAIRACSRQLTALLPQLAPWSLERVLADMQDILSSVQVLDMSDLGDGYPVDDRAFHLLQHSHP